MAVGGSGGGEGSTRTGGGSWLRPRERMGNGFAGTVPTKWRREREKNGGEDRRTPGGGTGQGITKDGNNGGGERKEIIGLGIWEEGGITVQAHGGRGNGKSGVDIVSRQSLGRR